MGLQDTTGTYASV